MEVPKVSSHFTARTSTHMSADRKEFTLTITGMGGELSGEHVILCLMEGMQKIAKKLLFKFQDVEITEPNK